MRLLRCALHFLWFLDHACAGAWPWPGTVWLVGATKSTPHTPQACHSTAQHQCLLWGQPLYHHMGLCGHGGLLGCFSASVKSKNRCHESGKRSNGRTVMLIVSGSYFPPQPCRSRRRGIKTQIRGMDFSNSLGLRAPPQGPSCGHCPGSKSRVYQHDQTVESRRRV